MVRPFHCHRAHLVHAFLTSFCLPGVIHTSVCSLQGQLAVSCPVSELAVRHPEFHGVSKRFVNVFRWVHITACIFMPLSLLSLFCLSTDMCMCVCVPLFTCLSTCLSVFATPPLFVSVCLSICVSVYLSVSKAHRALKTIYY